MGNGKVSAVIKSELEEWWKDPKEEYRVKERYSCVQACLYESDLFTSLLQFLLLLKDGSFVIRREETK